jgi:hypothetical protein
VIEVVKLMNEEKRLRVDDLLKHLAVHLKQVSARDLPSNSLKKERKQHLYSFLLHFMSLLRLLSYIVHSFPTYL